ncbi:aldo/keto reductase [Bradymonas sediminis]|uniref:Aldo/keto reductase n=1 Tax=Bradymonas sediminis TaxID=1548548 RepID=A0A2Z4FR03_9DELT|nr:aldo/keto reductase [Bradymonas sediminis]AWV91048.1 aldo/keto reductase [Bradymonas sediminis]TDP75211.1 aryl-alcohol dehydrogenase-like predicted oxidoreductase [Bradymonas sediminis]
MSNARRLGKTGLKVSRICLGTMMFGGRTDLKESRRIADACLERGAYFWDTADMYSLGASEEVVGKLMEGRRHEVVLATKAWATMSDLPNDRGLSARHLIAACEASLRRLGTDYLDIFYMHFTDPNTRTEESLRAMEDLVRSGKVRYVGVSNHQAWQVADRIAVARQHGWQPLDVVQPLYNILNRDIERELIPMAQHYGLGVVTYSSLARGVLTGKYKWDQAPPEGSRLSTGDKRMKQAEWREESLRVVEALRPLAESRNIPMSQLATAWALNNDYIDSVIIGPRTLEQAEDALACLDVDFDDELEEAIDALVPRGTHAGREIPDQEVFPVMGRRTKGA